MQLCLVVSVPFYKQFPQFVLALVIPWRQQQQTGQPLNPCWSRTLLAAIGATTCCCCCCNWLWRVAAAAVAVEVEDELEAEDVFGSWEAEDEDDPVAVSVRSHTAWTATAKWAIEIRGWWMDLRAEKMFTLHLAL